MNENSLPFSLPCAGKAGRPFIEILTERCQKKRLKDRMVAFIQEWGHVYEDVRQTEPGRADVTVEEFAERWNTSLPTAFRMQSEFREIFPTEKTPARLMELLWEGVPEGAGGLMKWLLAVHVVEDENDPLMGR